LKYRFISFTLWIYYNTVVLIVIQIDFHPLPHHDLLLINSARVKIQKSRGRRVSGKGYRLIYHYRNFVVVVGGAVITKRLSITATWLIVHESLWIVRRMCSLLSASIYIGWLLLTYLYSIHNIFEYTYIRLIYYIIIVTHYHICSYPSAA